MCVFATCACTLACHERALDLQIIGESRHLRRGDAMPLTSPWFDGETLRLVAARGETLGLQIVQRVPAPIALRLADAPITAATYRIEAAVVRRASTPGLYGSGSRGPGAYYDVLVADPAPATSSAYVELRVAETAAPGAYHGTLVAGARVVPIALEVVRASLAEAPRVWAYYDPRELAGTLDVPSRQERACIATFARYGVTLSPDLPLSAWPARRELLAGFPYVPARLSTDPAHVTDEVRAWIAATRGTEQVPFAIPIDEPRDANTRARVAELAQAARIGGSGPGRFLFAVTDEPRLADVGLVDGCMTQRPRRGDRNLRWSYNGRPPGAGAFVLDAADPGPRTWGWLAWRWRIPVWYVWDALYWHDRHNRRGALDYRVDAVSFSDGEDAGNLDGVLALPGDAETPCRPTLRLAAIHRGMQDAALLAAAAACDRATTEQLVDALIPSALGDAPHDGPAAWPVDEAVWENVHRRLLRIASCY